MLMITIAVMQNSGSVEERQIMMMPVVVEYVVCVEGEKREGTLAACSYAIL